MDQPPPSADPAALAALLPPPPPATPARVWAASVYLQLREKTTPPTFPAEADALDAMVLLLATRRAELPLDVPPADRTLLQMWSREGDWEGLVRTRQVQYALAHPLLRPEQKLSRFLTATEQAALILAEAEAAARSPAAGKDDVVRWKTAVNGFTELHHSLAAAEDELRRKVRDPAERAHWQEREEAIYQSVAQVYAGHGPHYELLVRQLARHEVLMEQLTQEGRDTPPQTLYEATRTMLSIVAQLQKYTEATKSETITQEVHQAVATVLEIIERIVSPAAPQLWYQVALEVRRLAGGDPLAAAETVSSSGAAGRSGSGGFLPRPAPAPILGEDPPRDEEEDET